MAKRTRRVPPNRKRLVPATLVAEVEEMPGGAPASRVGRVAESTPPSPPASVAAGEGPSNVDSGITGSSKMADVESIRTRESVKAGLTDPSALGVSSENEPECKDCDAPPPARPLGEEVSEASSEASAEGDASGRLDVGPFGFLYGR